MSSSTFSIEFPEHLPDERKKYLFNRLMEDCSVLIEQKDSNLFEIICYKQSQTERVGWALFHTHFNSFCTVVETSGNAVAKASAYRAPQKKRHSK